MSNIKEEDKGDNSKKLILENINTLTKKIEELSKKVESINKKKE